jgi:hypothetical protein
MLNNWNLMDELPQFKTNIFILFFILSVFQIESTGYSIS